MNGHNDTAERTGAAETFAELERAAAAGDVTTASRAVRALAALGYVVRVLRPIGPPVVSVGGRTLPAPRPDRRPRRGD